MSKPVILALFGKSGAGKDTIKKFILKHFKNFHEIVNSTTRPKREYEVDKKDYYFLSASEFQEQEMIEQNEFRGWQYGTAASEIKENTVNVGVFNIGGIKQLLSNPNYEVVPLYIVCSDKTRLIRCLKREDFPDCAEICRRFQADEEDFKQRNFACWFIWNNDRIDKRFIKQICLNYIR